MDGVRLKIKLHHCNVYAIQVYPHLATNCTAYFVDKNVVSNLNHASLPDGELHIFVKQQAVTQDFHLKIQYVRT